MFSTFAGMVMATKVFFNKMTYPVEKKKDSGVAESLYINNIEKLDEKEKYEKSKMPKSGYSTVEEYESASRAKTAKEIKVTKAEIPKDSNMVYVPHKTFKLVKYNNPAGSPELHLPRRLNFDRQINAQGIISGDKTMIVYPSVYYYAQTDCTSCDLFLIKLDSSLNDVDKVMTANIISKSKKPILSTSKEIDEKYIFRTLTPIDFSADNTKLVIKEKTGHRHDGIWKTELWVYDFVKQEATKFPQIRDAIVNYWLKANDIDFDEKRWDIYPLGFDANDDNRVIVSAYAYTGNIPKYLGAWSIDTEGLTTKLETLEPAALPVSLIGYRLEEDSVADASEVEFEAKRAKSIEKQQKKGDKKIKKEADNIKKLEYKRKINQMDMDVYFKIQQRKQYQKELKKAKTQIKEVVTAEE